MKLARGGRQETVFLTAMNGCPVTLEKGIWIQAKTKRSRKIMQSTREDNDTVRLVAAAIGHYCTIGTADCIWSIDF
jgi:hypothetical protein